MQAGLSLNWSGISKTVYLVKRLICAYMHYMFTFVNAWPVRISYIYYMFTFVNAWPVRILTFTTYLPSSVHDLYICLHVLYVYLRQCMTCTYSHIYYMFTFVSAWPVHILTYTTCLPSSMHDLYIFLHILHVYLRLCMTCTYSYIYYMFTFVYAWPVHILTYTICLPSSMHDLYIFFASFIDRMSLSAISFSRRAEICVQYCVTAVTWARHSSLM